MFMFMLIVYINIQICSCIDSIYVILYIIDNNINVDIGCRIRNFKYFNKLHEKTYFNSII